MLNRIYSIYLSVNNINNKKKNKLSRIINFIIYRILSFITNLIMPLSYKISKFSKNTNIINNRRDPKIIVSLTTFPARIDQVWLCIESLLRQSIKPDKIILWLAETQFNGKGNLPTKLLDLEKKGLSIEFCEDLRSHKKYYYSFKEYPDDIIITVDDDVFYPEYTLEKLLKLHEQYPNCICCNRGHYISFDPDGTVSPYMEWTKNEKNGEVTSKLICPTGVGGVLYPPHVMSPEVLNKKNIEKLCFFADDLWLKVMSLCKGTYVARTDNFPDPLFTIKSSQVESLSKINVTEGQNDQQLKSILEFYEIDLFQMMK